MPRRLGCAASSPTAAHRSGARLAIARVKLGRFEACAGHSKEAARGRRQARLLVSVLSSAAITPRLIESRCEPTGAGRFVGNATDAAPRRMRRSFCRHLSPSHYRRCELGSAPGQGDLGQELGPERGGRPRTVSEEATWTVPAGRTPRKPGDAADLSIRRVSERRQGFSYPGGLSLQRIVWRTESNRSNRSAPIHPS
jgi:hypothetical protein